MASGGCKPPGSPPGGLHPPLAMSVSSAIDPDDHENCPRPTVSTGGRYTDSESPRQPCGTSRVPSPDDQPCSLDDVGLTQVVRPTSVAELCEVVRRARADGQALFPLGGRTMLGV